MSPRARCAAAIMLALVALGCASSRPFIATVLNEPPHPDSATVLLLPMDEAGGFRVADAGQHAMAGTAGRDASSDFGRFRNARSFLSSIESFVYVPYAPILDVDPEITIEAWVRPRRFGTHELTMLASRWTEQANEKSWLLGIVGSKPPPFTLVNPSPGFHSEVVQFGSTGHLVFAYQPLDASGPLSYFSTEPLELDRWTHVAVSFNGEIVRIHLDGRLDAQYATQNRIRQSPAPLLIGNYFDPDWLTDFGGRLGITPGFDQTPYYAFEGWIDELRISRVAR